MYKLEYRVLDLGISQLVTRSIGVQGNAPWKIPADRQVSKLEYRVLDLGISQLDTRSVGVRGNEPWKIPADR